MKNLEALDQYRLKDVECGTYGATGDAHNGVFKVFVKGRSFFVIASTGGGWDHVSVSPGNKNRKICPTWDEMSAIKDMFFDPDECVVQYHPAKADYVNNHPYCLRLWRPNAGQVIATPPKIYV